MKQAKIIYCTHGVYSNEIRNLFQKGPKTFSQYMDELVQNLRIPGQQYSFVTPEGVVMRFGDEILDEGVSAAKMVAIGSETRVVQTLEHIKKDLITIY